MGKYLDAIISFIYCVRGGHILRCTEMIPGCAQGSLLTAHKKSYVLLGIELGSTDYTAVPSVLVVLAILALESLLLLALLFSSFVDGLG